MNDSSLSLETVAKLRGRAFTEIREHTAVIDGIAIAIADMDAALQTALEERTVDDWQALVSAARNLAQLMNGGQG